MIPITIAMILAMETAPAAMSLIHLISGRISWVIKLQVFSIAVFIASKPRTMQEIIRIKHHSNVEIPKL